MLPLRMRLSSALAAALLVFARPAWAGDAEPSPTPMPPLLDQRGIVVTEQEAFERVRFRPFVPVPRPLEVALLAPFHNPPNGGDNPRLYGIGFEYVQRGRHYVLRQWPKGLGTIAAFTPLGGDAACKQAYIVEGTAAEIGGIGWETARFVFVLQPDDGLAPVRDRGAGLRAEWHRLARRGACR